MFVKFVNNSWIIEHILSGGQSLVWTLYIYVRCFKQQLRMHPSKINSILNKTSPAKVRWHQTLFRTTTAAFNSFFGIFYSYILTTPTHVYCIIIVSSFIAGEGREMLPSLIASPLPRNLGPLSESASFVSPVHIYLRRQCIWFSLFILLWYTYHRRQFIWLTYRRCIACSKRYTYTK